MSLFPKRSLRLHAAAVGVLALLVYLLTCSPGVTPGRSASIIVRAANLEPITSYANPLYFLVAKVWLGLTAPVLGPAVSLNLLSALCGALALSFLFRLVAAIPHDRTSEETRLYTPVAMDALVSGWIAALAAMLSAPMWIASTRAYENTFGLCILLGTLLLLLRFKRVGGPWLARGIAVLIGLGCNEIPSMVILFPLLLVALGYLLTVHKLFTTRMILEVSGCLMLGASFSLVNAGLFMRTDMYEWAGFSSYTEVVRVLWRDQARSLVQAVPRVGWIIVSFLSVIPLIVIAVPKRAADFQVLGSTAGSYFLHVVLLGTSLFILLEGTLSPWTLFRDQPLLVSPYFMAAATLGYVVVYWVIIGYGVFKGTFFDRLPYRVFLPIGVVLAAGMMIRNASVVHRGPVRFANFVADRAVAGVGETDWLVSSSFMDNLMVIHAAKQGRDLAIINLGAGQAKPYKRYMADRFENLRYNSLIQVGVMPLVQEMITDTVTGHERVKVYNLPQLFRQNGLRPVPQGVLYSAVAPGEPIDLDELFADQKRFMQDLEGQLVWSKRRKAEALYLAPLLRQLSQSANNLGVLAWEEGRLDLAETGFNWALSINPENPSALLNRVSLGDAVPEDSLVAYEADLQDYVEANHEKMHLWNLSALHGYVVAPEAFAQEGLTWALSGSVGRSMGALQKAQETLGERADIQWILSNLYAQQGDFLASRHELESILEKNPDAVQVVLKLARLDISEQNFAGARDRLEALRGMKGGRHTADIELALLTGLEGRLKEAQDALMEITRLNSDDTRAWLALAAVSVDLEDSEDILAKAMVNIVKARLGGVSDAIQFARLLVYRGDYATASQVLASAVSVQPFNVPLLEYALQVDRLARDIPLARAHVEQLLAQDSRNGVGNRIMGSLQMHDGHYALAETSFRVSFEEVFHQDTATDLAWLLQLRGEYDEALDFANQAVAFNRETPSALHTRGLVYYRLGNYDAAKRDLLKALTIRIENPFAQLYLAMVYVETGEKDKARELLTVLEPVRIHLPQELQEELSKVTAKIIGSSES